MITIETLCVRLSGLDRPELERWIANAWVRPEGAPGAWLFRDIDVARVQLIQELRRDLLVEEETLPLVLSLLDQLYATRRQLRSVVAALRRGAPEETRLLLRDLLDGGEGEPAP